MASGFEKLPVLRSDVSSVRAAGKLSFKRKSEGESTRGEEEPPSSLLSPTKALRVALLKRRFAGTILRAQEKQVLHNYERGDPEKLRQGLKDLKRRQGKERRLIEAQVKAAEEELEQKRKMQREETGLKLEKMENTVEINDCYDIWEDLEKLGYAQHVGLSKKELRDLRAG